MSLLSQLTEGREESYLAAARSYFGLRWEWPNICHLLFILLSSAVRRDPDGAGWIGAFIVSVTVYLWICFALGGEGAEVYAVILGDVVSSARRRFFHRSTCPGALQHTDCSWSWDQAQVLGWTSLFYWSWNMEQAKTGQWLHAGTSGWYLRMALVLQIFCGK